MDEVYNLLKEQEERNKVNAEQDKQYWANQNEKAKQIQEADKINREMYGLEVPEEAYQKFNPIISNAENPEDEAYRIGLAYKYSEMMNIPLDEAYMNADAYNKAWWGEGEKSPKEWYKAVSDAYTMGKNNVRLGELGNKVREAELKGDTEALEVYMNEVNALNEQNNGLYDNAPRAWGTEALKAGAESLPFTGYVVGAGLFGNFVAPALGTALSFGTSSSLMAGQEYLSLREQGASPEVAGKVSAVSGALQGIVEIALGDVTGFLGAAGAKSIAGAFSDKAISTIATNMAKKFHFGPGAKIATKLATGYLWEVGGEGTEEALQELISIGAEDFASELGNYDIDEKTAKEIFTRQWEAYKGGVLGSLVLSGMPLAVNTTATVKDYQKVRQDAVTIDSEEVFANTVRDSAAFSPFKEEQKDKIIREVWDNYQDERDRNSQQRAEDIAEVVTADENVEENTIDEETGDVIQSEEEAYREEGKLHTENETTEEGGVFKVGNPENEKQNIYGYIDYKLDRDNKTVEIENFKMSASREGLREEFFDSFNEEFADYNIEWNPKGKIAQGIKENLVKNNITGEGLNYYANDTVENVRARKNVAKQLKQYMPNLDDSQRVSAVSLLEAMAQSQGQNLNEYIKGTFDTTIFGDIAEAEALAQEQGTTFQGKAGATTWRNFGNGVKAVIYAGQTADFSTWSHELAHVYQAQLQGDLKTQAEKAFNVENGDWLNSTYTFDDGRQMISAEAFAYGFQDWLETGKAPTAEQKTMFEKFAEFLSRAYNSLKKHLNLSDDIVKTYEQMLKGDDSLLAKAEQAVKKQNREQENIAKSKAEEEKKQQTLQKEEKEETTIQEPEEEVKQEPSTVEDTRQEDIEAIASETVSPEVAEGIAETITNPDTTLADKDESIYQALGNDVIPDDLFFQTEQETIKTASSMDNGTNFKELYERKNILFQEDPNTMLGIHNLNADNIRHVMKMGGLANPSMAVIDIARNKDFTSFGDITLLAPSWLIDKKEGRNAGTYGADIYSPRYPQITVEVTDTGRKQIRDVVSAIEDKELKDTIEHDFRYFLENNMTGINRSELQTAYLYEKGIKDFVEYEKPDYDTNTIKRVKDLGEIKNGNLADDPEYAIKLSEIYKDVKKDFVNNKNDKELYKILEEEYAEKANPKSIDYGRLSRFLSEIRKAENFKPGIDIFTTKKNAYKLVEEKYREDFEKWADEKRNQIETDEKIFNGFTPSGNRKYLSHTLENVSKYMKQQDLKGGESFNYGLGSTRAKFAPKFSNLKQIKKAKERLTTSEEFEKIKKEYNERFEKIYTELASKYDYDTGVSRYEEAILEHGNLSNEELSDWLYDNYDVIVDEDFVQEMKDFAKDLVSMPTEYFETKFTRPVSISEFAAAVIPENTPADIKEYLESQGLTIKEYTDNQAEAVAEYAKELSQRRKILFQAIGEKGAAALDEIDDKQRLQNLDKAKEYESKQSPERIKMLTGWEKAPDGKWRYETDDRSITLKHRNEVNKLFSSLRDGIIQQNVNAIKAIEARRQGETSLARVYNENAAMYNDAIKQIAVGVNNRISIGNLINNDELFNAYSWMKDVPVYFDAFTAPIKSAVNSNGIVLNAAYVQGEKNIIASLLHEMQHIIQTYEEMAGGTDLHDLRSLWDTLKLNTSTERGLTGDIYIDEEELNRVNKLFEDNVGEQEAQRVVERYLGDNSLLLYPHESNILFQDQEYLNAVEKNDEEKLQLLVDEAAEKSFPNSKVRDDAGKLLKVYHGRVSDFDVFKREYGNVEGDMGAGFYFTTQEDDVERNYANEEGPDLKNKIDILAERYENEEDMDWEEAEEKARNFYIKAEPNTVEAYLNIENPAIIDNYGQGTFLTYEEEYDEDNDEYGEPQGTLVEFIEMLNLNSKDYDTFEDINFWEYLNEDYYDGGMNLADVIRQIKEHNEGQLTDDEGNNAFNEVIRQSLEDIGFDGIEDHTVAEKFSKMEGLYEDTIHFIAFNSNQIKETDAVTYDENNNVIPLSQRFNKNNPSILFQKEQDKEYINAIDNDDIVTASKMVEQKAKENGFTDAIPAQAEGYTVRTRPAPKKTKTIYKTFYVDGQGRPSALFIGNSENLPMNVWIDAKDAYHFTDPKNGKQYVPSMSNPNNTKSHKTGDTHTFDEATKKELIKRGYITEKANSVTALAYRPGWHGGDLPFFPQGGKKVTGSNYGNIHRWNQVVFEIEIDADKDYTSEALENYNKKKASGDRKPQADLQYMPEGGYYQFTTNPTVKKQTGGKGDWYITQSIKIKRALTEEECNKILEENGLAPQEWEDKETGEIGNLDLSKLGYTGPEYDEAKKTLAPITYDEQGNVIPLSQRFNKNNPSILFQSMDEPENQWYENMYDLSQSKKAPISPDMTAEDNDKRFIEEISEPGNLENFLLEVNRTLNTEPWQPMDEEEAMEVESLSDKQDMINETLQHGNWIANAQRIANGEELTESTRKRLLTLLSNSPRDYRALYSQIMNREDYSVSEEETTTEQLKKRYKLNEIDIENKSPEQRRQIAVELENKEIGRKLKSGELLMDDELERYLKSVEKKLKESEKKYNALKKETDEDYKRIGDWEVRELLRIHDQLLEAQNKYDDITADIKKKIDRGLRITGQMQREADRLKNNYDNIFSKFRSLQKAMGLNQDIKDAIARREELNKIKNDLKGKQKEKRLVEQEKKIRTNLVKRAMRKISFDTVDYENAKTIIAIQELFEPNLLGGVNHWIGTEGPYLRAIYSQWNTDQDFKEKTTRELLKTRTGRRVIDLLNKTDSVEKFNQLTKEERKLLHRGLPQEDWIKELNLEELAEERKKILDLDLEEVIDRQFITKDGKQVEVEKKTLIPGEELKAEIIDAIGSDLYTSLVSRPFAEWTTEEMENLTKAINDLYREGRDILLAKNLERREAASRIRQQIEAVVKETGIQINPDDPEDVKQKKLEKISKILGNNSTMKGTIADKDNGYRNRINNLLHGYGDARVRSITRILDGYKDGINTKELYFKEDEAYNAKQNVIDKRSAKIVKAMKDFNIDIDELFQKVTISNFYNGEDVTFTVDELLYMKQAEQDPNSRNAVVYGNIGSSQQLLQEKEKLASLDAVDQTKPGTEKYKKLCDNLFKKVMAEADKLDPKFQKFADVIAEDYAEQYERMNKISIEEFNTPVNRVKNYVPLVRLESNGDTNENRVREDLLGINGLAKAGVDKGMTKRRIEISPLYQKPVEMGLYKTWSDSVERTEHFIAYSGYVRELNRVYRSKDANYTRQFIENRYGKAMIKYIDDYIEEVANPDAASGQSELDKLIRTLRGKTAPAYLAWKMSSIIKQAATSPAPFFQFVNPLKYIAASFDIIRSKGTLYDAIKDKSAFMRNRVQDPIYDLIDEQLNKANKNKVEAGIDKFSKVGMKGLEMIDWACVAPGWLACYRQKLTELSKAQMTKFETLKADLEAKNANLDYDDENYLTKEEIDSRATKLLEDLNEDEAVKYADDCTRLSQPSSRLTDIAPLFKAKGQGSEIAKAFLQFQTSLNVIWNNIRYDLPYAVRNKNYSQAVGIVASYVIAGVVMNMIVDGLPEDDEDKVKQIVYYGTTQFTDSIPVLGSAITRMNEKVITGKSSFYSQGSDITPMMSKFIQAAQSGATGDWEKAVERTAEGIGLFTGLPVSGAKELKYVFTEPGISALWGRRE